MVMLIAAYLFDLPSTCSTQGKYDGTVLTRSPVPGNSLADKPAYILTSRSTSPVQSTSPMI